LGSLVTGRIGFNLAKAAVKLSGLLAHPLPVCRICVLFPAGPLREDSLVGFERGDALLDAAQLFRQYQEVVLIAGLLGCHQPRFGQCGPARLNVVIGTLQFACKHR